MGGPMSLGWLKVWQSLRPVNLVDTRLERPAESLRRFLGLAWSAAGEMTAESREDSGAAGAEPETDLRLIARRLARPAVWGLLATMAITYGASQFGSPFALKLPGAWFFGVPSITTPPGRGMLISLVASWGGMFLLVRAWLEMLKAVSPTRSEGRPVPLKALAVVAGLWMIPLLVGPPMFSQDVYSYAAQGAMATAGINPYHHGPDSLGVNNPYYPFVDQLWGASPAPYGPVFIILDAAIVTLTGHHVLATVLGLRLLAVFGVVLLAVFLPKLGRTLGRDPGTIFTLAVLNPVTLLHLVAGAHNDALMLGLLVMGLYLARRRHPVWGVVLCTLSAATKAPGAIGIVYIGWQWLGSGLPWRHRVRPLMTAGLLAGGVAAVITAFSGLGWAWVKALSNPSVVRSVIDPMTALGMILGSLTRLVGLGGVTFALHVTRGLGFLLAALVCGACLVHSDRLGTIKAVGLSLLAVVVLGPVVQPWYLAWGIVLLAPVASGRWRMVVVGTSLVGAFIGFPGGWELLQGLERASVWSMAVALVILLAVPVPPLVRRVRHFLAGRRPETTGLPELRGLPEVLGQPTPA
jgi:alpha-1,6-mannosyltransferase